MAYYIIIRGPAGVGKSTVAGRLAKRLKGIHISFDKIMHDNRLDKIEGSGISENNFIKANEIAIPKATKNILKGKIVVFDGCFYHKSQLEHLVKNLQYSHFDFTLKAPLEECILRDGKRSKNIRIGEKSIKDVYRLVSKFDYGNIIKTHNKTLDEIVKEILFLPEK